MKRAGWVLGLTAAAIMAWGASAQATPPHVDGLTNMLKAKGMLPNNASPTQVKQAITTYLQQKFPAGVDTRNNPKAADLVRKGEAKGKFKTQGQMRPNNKRFDNVLTFLVEFGTDATGTGPLHNEIAPPAAGDNTTYWVSDFSSAHYQKMLFDKTPGARSMYNYYLEQSGGSYAVDGTVTQWVKVDHPEKHYGADGPTGIDNANGPVWRVVRDAVKKAGCSINWADYDKEDPYDIDGDGNTAEPDGYVDHIQFVHAGADQSGGGGAQGDDAIWAHSWWVADWSDGPAPAQGWPGVKPCANVNVWVGPYTINPEDGNIGVFCHEFAHDLGLPDQYDTIYSGEASTGFWTLMSSGSWSGCPGQALGTCPASMNAWEKWAMGWVDPITVLPGQKLKNVVLKETTAKGKTNKAIRVLLPNYTFGETVNTPHSGTHEWYSGAGNNLNNTLTQTGTYTVASAADKLTFWTMYDIELDWDYAYVEISNDGGATWTSIAGNITTTVDPNGQNAGNGITGLNASWTQAEFSLADYVGDTIMFRFRYWTDPYVQNMGMAIDDVQLTINGAVAFSDSMDSGTAGWTSAGWIHTTGSTTATAGHYYMMEWRTAKGFDVSMNSWYNYIGGGEAEYFKAHPGMVVWYRNLRYSDNHVGVHPWAGQLLVVDSHPQTITASYPGYFLPSRTRIQICDAAFNVTPIPEQTLTNYYGYPFYTTLPASAGVPTFDDSQSYVDDWYGPYIGLGYLGIDESISSVRTPTYGLKATVKSQTSVAGKIDVDFSGFAPVPLTATVNVKPEPTLAGGCNVGGGQAALPGLLVLFGLIALALRRRD